jgi:Transposase DNA-binding/Transposase Tn5 dimerisation domain
MTQTAAEWAQETWGTVELGDQRLNRRAIEIGTRIAANPAGSLPQQMQSGSDLQAAYRFMNNRHIHLDDLLKPHCGATRQVAGEQKVVLWVNDLTEVDYTFHNAKTGLGPIGDDRGKGFLLHSSLGIVPEGRQVLGLGSVQVFLRQAVAKPRPKWTRTAEGLAWEQAAGKIGSAPAGVLWVHVSDAGSDYFPYMAACVDQGKHFLVRVSRNRVLTWDDEDPQAGRIEAYKLVDYARSLALQTGSAYWVQLAAHKKQPVRQAQVGMAWAEVTLSPSPQAPAAERTHPPLTAWVLRVWEPAPPENVEALEWILLSSLPVSNLQEALCRVDWYTCRWLCEDFHQALKTGCKIERSQLDDRADLENLLGFAAPIAVRLLQLRQAARHSPQTLASHVVDPLMLKVLALHQKTNPQTLTLHDFWRLVAGLGGFLGRKSDGDPGWRTVWRGWRFLSDLTDGARLVAFSGFP